MPARTLVVPYRLAEPLLRLVDLTAPDDVVVVARGEAQATTARIHTRVADVLGSSGEPTFVIAGEGVVASAVVAGVQRRERAVSLVWCSARAALHTPATASGATGVNGIALAMILGTCGRTLTARYGFSPLPPAHAVVVDGRASDDVDRAALDAIPVARLDCSELAAAALPAPPWIVHLDLDLFDPAEVPALIAPASEGPPRSGVLAALAALARRGTIAACSVAVSLTARGLDDPAAPGLLAALRGAVMGQE